MPLVDPRVRASRPACSGSATRAGRPSTGLAEKQGQRRPHAPAPNIAIRLIFRLSMCGDLDRTAILLITNEVDIIEQGPTVGPAGSGEFESSSR